MVKQTGQAYAPIASLGVPVTHLTMTSTLSTGVTANVALPFNWTFMRRSTPITPLP